MMFKEGDVVRLISYERAREMNNQGVGINNEMEQYFGKVVTINRFIGADCFTVVGNDWSWMTQWIEIKPRTTREKRALKLGGL